MKRPLLKINSSLGLFVLLASFVTGAKPRATNDDWDIARGISQVYFNPLFWICVIGCLVALRRARSDTERPSPQEPLGPPTPPANLPTDRAKYGEGESLSGDIGEDAQSDTHLKSPERLLLERGGLLLLIIVAVLFTTRLVRNINDVLNDVRSRERASAREFEEVFNIERIPERLYDE